MGITNPPAESIAADEPAAVETLRPLDRQFTNGEHGMPSLLILPTFSMRLIICKIQHLVYKWGSATHFYKEIPYLNENRETMAGQGCAIKMSLRAKVGRDFEFTRINILDKFDGTVLPSRMLSRS